MKKNVKWIIGGILIILIGVVIWVSVTKKEKYFDKIELPDTIMVYNKTKWSYLDTIVYIGVDVLGVKPKIVVIEELTDNNKPKSDLTELYLDAYIFGVDGQYILSIREMGREKSILTISHELIHLQQNEEGRLINKPDTLIFENKIYLRKNMMGYTDRPWEVESYKRQYWLRDRIKDLVYSNK